MKEVVVVVDVADPDVVGPAAVSSSPELHAASSRSRESPPERERTAMEPAPRRRERIVHGAVRAPVTTALASRGPKVGGCGRAAPVPRRTTTVRDPGSTCTI